MTSGLTVRRKFHIQRGRRGRKDLHEGQGPPVASVGRTPRVARLMALAIHFDQLIHEGVVTDQAELARLGHVSRARLTQIMNLLNLAPDIQEAILRLPSTEHGHDPITEPDLRPIATVLDWRKQRTLWRRLVHERTVDGG
jgi:hypothetical protein